MKILGILVVLIVLLLGAFMFFSEPGNTPSPNRPATTTPEAPPSEADATEVYSNGTIGLQFTYPPEYVLSEPTVNANGDLVETIVLMQESDAENIPQDGEAPPTITITVYRNTERAFPGVWAEENPMQSNSGMIIGSTTETTVGGANAVRYIADGLYASDTVVAAHDPYMYVFSAAYVDENSPTIRDFPKILSSVQFIPEPNVQ